MQKRLVVSGLLCTTLLLTGCSTNANEHPVKTSIADNQQQQDLQITETEQQQITAMLPLLDNLIRTMNEFDTQTLEPKNPMFFWTALYLSISDYYAQHPMIEVTDTEITARTMVFQEYASALFFDYNDLLPIPEEFSHMITYDESYDAYSLLHSDRYPATAAIEQLSKLPDQSITAQLSFSYPDDTTYYYMAHLAPNPYVQGITEPIFYYSVDSLEQLNEELGYVEVDNYTFNTETKELTYPLENPSTSELVFSPEFRVTYFDETTSQWVDHPINQNFSFIELAQTLPPGATTQDSIDLASVVENLTPGSYMLIKTYHQNDRSIDLNICFDIITQGNPTNFSSAIKCGTID